ncbi:MAG: hypothetical protein GF311_02580 [Candidatus Lokiarchaeota archaeon]|nr:hypothetical protein [Candidatus Lokiarchaeota archaeon]
MSETYRCNTGCSSHACWNDCEDSLKEKINRSKFVNKIRNKLMEKKYEKLDH